MRVMDAPGDLVPIPPPTKPPEVLGDVVDLPDLLEELPTTENADQKVDNAIPRLVTKEEIRNSWENYKGPSTKIEKSEASESSAPAEQPEAPAKAEPTKMLRRKWKPKRTRQNQSTPQDNGSEIKFWIRSASRTATSAKTGELRDRIVRKLEDQKAFGLRFGLS